MPQPGSLAWSLHHAAHLVAAVREGRSLTQAFAALEKTLDAGAGDGRAAVRDLTWTCLRDFGRGDALLRRLVERSVPAPAHALLLVALCRLERRPEDAHTTVDQAVLAMACVAPGLKGLGNGVLRTFLRRKDALLADLDREDEARFAHPQWWVDRMRRDHPIGWEGALQAGNTHPPMAVRANLRRTTVAELHATLQGADIACKRLENDALVLERALPAARLPGFEAGMVSIQDAGAQYAAHWLAPRKGERVLDACAAPGGKTAHLLEWADIELTALDLDAQRLQSVSDNLARLGLTAQCVVADASEVGRWWDGLPFDAILADVPCSGSGVARRHPDIKWLRREADIAGFAAQQRRILDALWRTLAQGGRMLYATCSVFAEENDGQIESFLRRHGDAERVPLAGRPADQLLPGAEHDGFYYALLRKHLA